MVLTTFSIESDYCIYIIGIRLDKNGKELSQLVLGGKGLDEVEKMIPTVDGGALLGIYSRSGEALGSGKPQAGSTTQPANPSSTARSKQQLRGRRLLDR